MAISLNPSSLLNGQGIDVNSLVNTILSQQSGQLQQWQAEQSTLKIQANLLTSINGDLNTLDAAMTALSDPLGALTGVAANSSDTGVLSATAESTASAGVHQIAVSNLATPGLVYTAPVTDGTTSILPSGASSGTIELQVGGSAGATHDIQITAGSNDTLNTLASFINQQGWGVTANVVTDANGARLALYSQATGSAGALAINSNDTSLSFNAPSGGANAQLTIDGVPYSSTTNTISGAIAGVTFTLAGKSGNSPVQLTVGPDTAAATNAINNFVSAYNQVIADINLQYTVDSSTNSEGPLGSDSALRQLQSSLLSDVTYSTSSGPFTNLASLGINMNDDGTLTVDSTQLNSSISSNPSAFLNFFQNATQSGFADMFHADLNNLTDSTQGLLNVDLSQNQVQQKSVADSIANFQDQLAAQQKALTDQFSKLNASLQSYPLLLQQVTETLAALGSGSNSGSTAPIKTSGL